MKGLTMLTVVINALVQQEEMVTVITCLHYISVWIHWIPKNWNVQEIFTINKIELFRTIAEWYLLFFAKFLSHRVKNEKILMKTSSQLNAPVLMTEPP